MASQHSNMRRLSKGRAQWRQDAVDRESAAVPKRVTPHLPREGPSVFWKCGMSFSPSFSSSWFKSTKGQPQIFAVKRRLLKNSISTCLRNFSGNESDAVYRRKPSCHLCQRRGLQSRNAQRRGMRTFEENRRRDSLHPI